MSEPPLPPSPMTENTRLRSHFAQARGSFVAAALMLLLHSAATVMAALAVKLLIDLLFPVMIQKDLWLKPQWLIELPVEPLWAIGGTLFGLTLLMVASSWLGDRLTTTAARLVVDRARNELLSLLMSRRQAFFDTMDSSEILSRLSEDVDQVGAWARARTHFLFHSVPTLVLMLIALVAVLVEDRHIPIVPAVLLGATVIALALTGRFLARLANTRRHRVRIETARLETELTSAFNSTALMKSMTLEEAALENLHHRLRRFSQASLASEQTQNSITSGFGGVLNMLRATVLIGGAFAVFQRQFDLGSVAFFVTAIEVMATPVSEFVRLSAGQTRFQAATERLDAFYTRMAGFAELEGNHNTSSLPLPDAGTIYFENVSLELTPSQPSFTELTGAFESGEIIGLASATRAIPRAFGELLNRILDPSEGRILIGRTDLRRFRLKLLRGTVTLATTDAFFVPGTVRENLLLTTQHETDIDDQKVNEALHAAAAAEMVGLLPSRLDTLIGEGGVELTRDQAKRLNLARAFLRRESFKLESRIFVFEEPTEGLNEDDADTVMTSIRELSEEGATIFLQTRQALEIAQCDRVIYFGSDPVPIISGHDELWRIHDLYRRIFLPPPSTLVLPVHRLPMVTHAASRPADARTEIET